MNTLIVSSLSRAFASVVDFAKRRPVLTGLIVLGLFILPPLSTMFGWLRALSANLGVASASVSKVLSSLERLLTERTGKWAWARWILFATLFIPIPGLSLFLAGYVLLDKTKRQKAGFDLDASATTAAAQDSTSPLFSSPLTQGSKLKTVVSKLADGTEVMETVTELTGAKKAWNLEPLLQNWRNVLQSI